MRFCVLIVCTCLIASSAMGLQAEEETKVSVAVPKGDTITIAVPEKWKHTVTKSNLKIPPTVSLTEKGTGLNLLLTFIPDPDKKVSKPADVEKFVKLTCQQYVGGSVEKEIKLQPIKSDHGFGSYSTFTDASLVDTKEPAAGEFRYVTSGMFVIGKQCATLTLLSNDIAGAEYQAALKILTEGIELAESAKP